jgi:Na+-translocating ferredoxin:NAD+ oxidoreductase subunit C
VFDSGQHSRAVSRCRRAQARPGELRDPAAALRPAAVWCRCGNAGKPGGARWSAKGEVVAGAAAGAADGETSVPLHAPATGRVQRIASSRPGRRHRARDPAGPVSGDTQEYPAGPGCDPDCNSAAASSQPSARPASSAWAARRGPTHARLRRRPDPRRNCWCSTASRCEPVFSRVPAMLREHAGDVLIGVRFLLKATGAPAPCSPWNSRTRNPARRLVAAAPAGLPLEPACCRRATRRARRRCCRVLSRARARRGAADRRRRAVPQRGHRGRDRRLLAQGRGMTDQVVTSPAARCASPGNYRVPLGTPLRFALAAGVRPELARVLRAGRCAVEALASLDVPITKGTTGFIALDREEAGVAGAAPAVHPLRRVRRRLPGAAAPGQLGLLARKGELKQCMRIIILDHCFECGCCAYVCPSRLPWCRFPGRQGAVAPAPAAAAGRRRSAVTRLPELTSRRAAPARRQRGAAAHAARGHRPAAGDRVRRVLFGLAALATPRRRSWPACWPSGCARPRRRWATARRCSPGCCSA